MPDLRGLLPAAALVPRAARRGTPGAGPPRAGWRSVTAQGKVTPSLAGACGRHYLNQDEALAGEGRVLKRCLKPDRFMVDDMGMEQLPRKGGEFLFEGGRASGPSWLTVPGPFRCRTAFIEGGPRYRQWRRSGGPQVALRRIAAPEGVELERLQRDRVCGMPARGASRKAVHWDRIAAAAGRVLRPAGIGSQETADEP